MKRVLLILILCVPAWAVNNPLADPNCIGYWPFDTTTNWDDQSDAVNHLYLQSGIQITTGDKKEGDASADFEASSLNQLHLNDTDLASGFPCKSGETNTTFSITCWFKPESIGSNQYLVAKYQGSTDKRCWGIYTNASSKLGFLWGHSGGGSTYVYEVNRVLSTDTWYFIKIVFNDASNDCDAYLYDSGNTTWYASDNTPANAINNEDAPLYIGRELGGEFWDGLIDEVGVFNDVVTDANAIAIVAQTYDYDSDPNLISLWSMDTDGLGVDTESTNDLLRVGLITTSGPKIGDGCADFEGSYNAMVGCLDGNLSATFPCKNGGSAVIIATICFWAKPESIAGDVSTHAVNKWSNTAADRPWTIGWDIADDYWEIGTQSGGVESDKAAVADTWYFVAVTLNDPNTTTTIFVWDDDAETMTEASSSLGALAGDPAPFAIGCSSRTSLTYNYLGPSAYDYDGVIDDLMIFDDILTDAEILQIKNGTFLASAVIYPKQHPINRGSYQGIGAGL